MIFEWDPEKARANRAKHGIAFEEAATTFFDPRGIDMPDRAHSSVREIRNIRLGMSLASRVLMAVHTRRENRHGQETIRIISARKANEKERALYVGNL